MKNDLWIATQSTTIFDIRKGDTFVEGTNGWLSDKNGEEVCHVRSTMAQMLMVKIERSCAI